MNQVYDNGKFNEEELENSFIELFKSLDYQYVCGENIHRYFKEILLYDDLANYLTTRYNELSENEIKRIISMLDNVPALPLYEGNKETYKIVTEGFDFNRDDSNLLPIHIEFINFEEPNNNIFKIVN